MTDKKIGESEAMELKKVYNIYLDKRSNSMRNTVIKVGEVFAHTSKKQAASLEKITELKVIWPQ